MSNYTVTTNFGAKDSLPSGNAAKVIKGSEFTTEFTNIQTAIATKADTAGDTFTGAVTFDAAVTLNADVTFDTNTLFVDVSANRVGIGNVAPATALDVTGVITTDGLTSSAGIDVTGTVTASGLTVDTDTLYVDATNDRVGIGTTSPLADLHVSNGTNSDSTPVEFMIGGTANSVRTGSIVKGTTSGAYDLTLQTSNHATQNQPLIIKLSDATEAMRIDSSGNVGIGTTSPATALDVTGSLTVSSATANVADLRRANNTGAGQVLLGNSDGYARLSGTNGSFDIFNSGNTAQRFGIANNGDISFYEDTGATAKLFWDASAKSLGIGTTSPDGILHAHKANAGADTAIMLENSGQSGTSTASLVFTGNGGAGQEKARIKSAVYGDGYMAFHTNDDTEKMRIDSSGNVGIGTDDPQRELEVSGTGNVYVKVTAPTASDSAGLELANTGATWLIQNDDTSSEALTFDRAGTEVMRIDASGNVLVGKTSTAFGTAGSVSYATGLLTATVDGNACVQLNRLTSDGVIQTFGKNGTTVGSIGTFASDLTIGTTDVGVRFDDNASAYIPWNTTSNSATDATIDLGASTVRYKDLYRSGSTYSTSDRNKKQDIRDLTDAEARVAVVAKGSLKAFRYIDTVEAEGDDANIHFGIIAQDLKAAFEAEGLNADSYQVLKTSTYIDDDGVEQTTYSVCYENLLAFIISAI